MLKEEKKAHLILPEGRDVELDVITDNMGNHSIDIASLRKDTGYITYDPGFMNTGSCMSSICYINGEKDRGLGYTDLGKSLLETVYKALKIDFICNRFESNRPSAEAVLEIDPDIISIGGIYQKKRLAELYSTAPWNQIKAVRENQVYNIPVGFVGFEQTCSASALFIYSQANQIYPELFDFDLVTLTQEWLQKYFNYTLSDIAAKNLLDGYFKDGSLMIE